MKLKTLHQLYILASVAFLLALLKYAFLESYVPVNFFIVEITSFLLFLGVIYFSDKVIRTRDNERFVFAEEKEKLHKKYQKKIDNLNNRIDSLKPDKKSEAATNDQIDFIGGTIADHLKAKKHTNSVGTELLLQVAKFYEIGIGICYLKSEPSMDLCVSGTFALGEEEVSVGSPIQEGLQTQSLIEKRAMVICDIDEEYFDIESCSGSSKPRFLYFLPIVKSGDVIGLLELAAFKAISIENHWERINKYIAESIVL